MKETLIKDFGRIVTFKDYIQIIRDEDSITYLQTRELDVATENRYNKRMISIHLLDNYVIVSSAIASLQDNELTNASGQRVTTSRILDLVNRHKMCIHQNVKGITYVTRENLDSLIEDPYVYSALSGPLDKDQLTEAVTTLTKSETRYIKKQISSCFAARKRELESSK